MNTIRPGGPLKPSGGDQTPNTGKVQGETRGHSFTVQSGKPNPILNNKTAEDLNRITAEMKTHKFTVGNPFSKAFNKVKSLLSNIFSKKSNVETRERSQAQLLPNTSVAKSDGPAKTQPISREVQAQGIRRLMDDMIIEKTSSLRNASKALIKSDNERFLQNERSLNAGAAEARNALNDWKNQAGGPPFDLDKAMSRFDDAARNWEADNLLADNNQ